MSTPEGKTKARIKKVLDKHKGSMYVYMPVPGGFGSPTLDYLGCFHGLFFAIEAKAPGKVPTPRQEGTLDTMRAANARVFVIDGDTSELERWLAGFGDRR
jgi:hypothetical protein